MTQHRTVAVTGAGGGIGFALALEFATRGYDVLALDLDPAMAEPLERASADLAGTITFRELDITAPGDFEFPAELDVLVNNAGIRRSYLSVEHTPEDDWRKVFEVNFF